MQNRCRCICFDRHLKKQVLILQVMDAMFSDVTTAGS
jgi:hypothetical protein